MRAAALIENLRDKMEHVNWEQNPWLNDQVLLNLAVWWVKSTRPNVADFSAEVALEFDSLQRDLRQNS